MVNRKRTAAILACVVILTLLLAACGGQLSGATGGNKRKIGFAVSTLANPFFVSLRDGAQKKASSAGYDLLVADAQDDNAKQADQIGNFITQKVDVLIVNPTDSDAVSPSIRKANGANIPVIALDRSANAGSVASFIASDNVSAGKLGAEQLIRAVPQGAKVAMLVGVPGASAARDRGQGFIAGLADSSVNTKGATLVAQQVANFKRDEALNVMQNILTANPDLNGVFCQNDDMALGAVQAVKAKGLTGKVFIVGVDGIPEARAAVKAGDISADIAQRPDVMGRIGVETAQKIINKQSVPANQKVPLQVLTKENA
jgi:ribose transport system substrate-binding protein